MLQLCVACKKNRRHDLTYPRGVSGAAEALP